MVKSGFDVYRKTEVETADPLKLVLICYDEAIKNLKIAREKYLNEEFEDKAYALKRAISFISELNRALDLEKGGEIAANLHALYDFMVRHLMEGDLKKDIKAFDQVIAMLSELKEAWEIVSYQLGRQRPGSENRPRVGTALG